MKTTTVYEILKAIGAIVICQLAGIIGSLFTASSIGSWYSALNKPSFNPPNWVFGPVWITLYTMMGISLYLVWRSGSRDWLVLGVFGLQLVLNTLWSILFFGMHAPGWAFVEIVVLWASIVATIVVFFGVSRTASYLLIPYALWVSFAALLNFMLWRLNR
ncbi:tryptophan-rich sensory protein [Candidatus Woesearchaeota archaeon]|nr:tryptophan-rich sensory protein [Candidatus Woesearchaeota archaeon]